MSLPEVNSKVPLGVLAELQRRGHDPRRLLARLPVTLEELSGTRHHIGWNEFVEILDRARSALGGPMALASLCGATIQVAPEMRALGALVVSPRRLYLSVAERVARSLYRVVGCRIGELPDGRIWAETTIPLRYRDSTSFHYASLGTLQVYPRLVGADDARIEAEIGTHRALFVIEPPETHTVTERARQLLRSPLDWIRSGTRSGVEATQEHVLAGLELAYGEGATRELAAALGDQLSKAGSLGEIAEQLSCFLLERFGSGHLVLTARLRDGTWCEPTVVPGESTALTLRRTLPLTIGDREVGRIEVDVPQLALEEPVPLLAAAMPWIALAVERCSAAGVGGGGDDGRTARAAERWRLSRRQSEALTLLASGCSNKEIARALGTSLKTVEAHVTEILRKAQVDSRAALVARVWSARD